MGRSRSSFRPTAQEPLPGTGEGLPDANPEDVARTIALRALDHAPKTRHQLAELLESRGIPDDAAATVLDRFEEVRLIDDALFAQMWVRSRHSSRGLARRVLKHELLTKGVAQDDIDVALEQIDDESERLAAEDLARRKIRSMTRLERAAVKRRLFAMLVRRGYSSSVASKAVEVVLAEQASEVEAQEGSAVP
ncbi:MAG: regulatory protein RecX [Candidatus Nanopelagicales bacterium]|nr:regulatory protein RecX [Candidatus Nanopelagicales bacterium]